MGVMNRAMQLHMPLHGDGGKCSIRARLRVRGYTGVRGMKGCVMTFDNDAPARVLPGAVWVKSSASWGEGNCVELTGLADGEVAIRNSRQPEGPALVYTRTEMAAFVAGVKAGEFDHLIA
jgi:hypothetical protein